MKVESIKNDLHELIIFYKDNLNKSYIQIDMMFVKKTSSKVKLYKTWMLAFKNNDITDMISETLDTMDATISNREIVKYDLELSADDTVQIVDEGQVVNHKAVEESITIELTPNNSVSDSMNYNMFDFVVMKLSDNSENSNESLTIYKKHMKSPAKFKGTRSFLLNGTEGVIFEKPLLIIGSNVEAFHYGASFYIFNRNSFNSMLNFKDVYYKIVEDNIDSIKESELFDDTDSFISECRDNGRYVTRLTKAILADGFTNVKDNKSKLKNLKKDYGLKFEITKEGKIKFDKDYVDEILNLLLEHYVTSALTDKKMLALAVEKYE